MERKTKQIETPVGGHKVVLQEFITGGEKRRLIAEQDQAKSQALIMSIIVVSVDGKSENVAQVVDEMHGKDFDFVFQEITKVLTDSSYLPEEKKSA